MVKIEMVKIICLVPNKNPQFPHNLTIYLAHLSFWNQKEVSMCGTHDLEIRVVYTSWNAFTGR